MQKGRRGPAALRSSPVRDRLPWSGCCLGGAGPSVPCSRGAPRYQSPGRRVMARHPRTRPPEDRRSCHDLHERTAHTQLPRSRALVNTPLTCDERAKAQVSGHAPFTRSSQNFRTSSACRPQRETRTRPAGVGSQPSGRRDHDGAGRRGGEQRRVEQRGGAGPLRGRLAAGDHVDGEVEAARPGADPGQRAGHLEDVAGPDRREELHVGVRREQPLVAVGADAQLGGDVAEQLQAVGAVDQVAGVVGVGVGT